MRFESITIQFDVEAGPEMDEEEEADLEEALTHLLLERGFKVIGWDWRGEA